MTKIHLSLLSKMTGITVSLTFCCTNFVHLVFTSNVSDIIKPLPATVNINTLDFIAVPVLKKDEEKTKTVNQFGTHCN